jgi:hypothetical protein
VRLPGHNEFIAALPPVLAAPDVARHIVHHAPAPAVSAATRALLSRTLEWIARVGRSAVPPDQPPTEWARDAEAPAPWPAGCSSARGTYSSHDLGLSGPKSEWRRKLRAARTRVADDAAAAHLGAVLAFGVAYTTAAVGGSKIHGCLSTYCARIPMVWCAAHRSGARAAAESRSIISSDRSGRRARQ